MNYFFDHWEIEYPTKDHNYNENIDDLNNSKYVRFKNSTDMILVPTREELNSSGVHIWYSEKDIDTFKSDVNYESEFPHNKVEDSYIDCLNDMKETTLSLKESSDIPKKVKL